MSPAPFAPVDHLASWLQVFGRGPTPPPVLAGARCAHLEWAASGAMSFTGDIDGAPALARSGIVPLLRAIDRELRTRTGDAGTVVGIDPAEVLAARAGLRRTPRTSQHSTSGRTRLMATADGWAAVSLVRRDDIEAVPAMFDMSVPSDPWLTLALAAARRSTSEFVASVRLLGVPAAAVPTEVVAPTAPWRVTRIAPSLVGTRIGGALVVDLSSLWAGPLAGQLLTRAGARVVKVESVRRPDGARSGDPRFYDWLHAGQKSVALDFDDPEGRRRLRALVEAADVVIEASRPRALRQLGVDHESVTLRPGAVWVSITGHGRTQPDLVAFGDDAAAAGGLVSGTTAAPTFCGDAIADPLTGVVAALGAAASIGAGGGHLVDVSMRDVAACFASAEIACRGEHRVERRRNSWFVRCQDTDSEQRVLQARAPSAVGKAPRMGADTRRVMRSLAAMSWARSA